MAGESDETSAADRIAAAGRGMQATGCAMIQGCLALAFLAGVALVAGSYWFP